jgi:hypothetical protein
MKKFYLPLIFLLLSVSSFSQNAWINEFHYDNVSTDSLEFIEIVIQNPGSFLLSDFTITLYNGNNGSSYNTQTLDQFTFSQVDPNDNSFSYYYFIYPANGIQNGSPDGICLDYQGSVILFTSYEGTFTATDGPANGLLSTDIGVSETTSTPVGSSVGLTGSGTQYSDFTWTNFDGTATIGSPNGSQILPVELSSFSATANKNNVALNWSTASEVNNSGFEIERAGNNSDFVKVGFIPGAGTTTDIRSYSFVDNNLNIGTYTYRLKQVDFDGTFAYSDEVSVDITSPAEFELAQNYPNPFNPNTRITFSLAADSKVSLKVFNILGEEIFNLLNANISAGVHEFDLNASSLNSGVYLYRIEAIGLDGTRFIDVKKMTLIK